VSQINFPASRPKMQAPTAEERAKHTVTFNALHPDQGRVTGLETLC
jgi:hypothetical protein